MHSSDVNHGAECNVALFGLYKYVDRICPNGQTPPSSHSTRFFIALNLAGILQERQGMFESAVKSFSRCLSIMEPNIPANDPFVMRIKENLARSLCSLGSYEDSIDYYKQIYSVGNISSGLGHVGVGMSFFFDGKVADGFKWFEDGLKTMDGYAADRVMIMIAQVLYALGTEKHRALSKQQFLSRFALCLTHPSLEKNRLNIRALLGLASFGLVTNDGSLARQAASELVKISPDVLIGSELEEDVDLLLSRLFMLLVCEMPLT